MGNFRSDRRESFGGNRSGNRGFGGRPGGFNRGGRGFGDRDSGGFGGRRNFEKTEVTCDKCGKMTDVPFKPTTGKPVYCRDCFSGRSNSNANFAAAGAPAGNGASSEQLDKINAKLDKILEILEQIEFEEEEEESDEEESETA